MAAAFLGAELECFICTNIYTDPVMLICGHNFCRICIGRVLDTQEGSGDIFCPQCREKFLDRPALHRNITLHNIVEKFLSAQPDQEESGDSGVHKKTPEPIFTDPTLSLERRICSVHGEGLKYFCTEDDACICESCYVVGGHKGHEMVSLDEASAKKKETLRNVLQKLLTKREEMEERVQSLQEHRRKVEEAAGDTERVTAMYGQLGRCLEALEKRVLKGMLGQAKQVILSTSGLIQKLELKKFELSRKMNDIEEMCNMTDPPTVLQESDTGDLCDTEDGDDEDRERHEDLLHDGGGVDVAGVLHTGISDIITEGNVYFYIQGAEDILLDVNTADNRLEISDDRKTASWSEIFQNRPKTPERFQFCPQVMSSQSFFSGRHYWEVDVGGSYRWRVGMCYPSIDRNSIIGSSGKAWCFEQQGVCYDMIGNSKTIHLASNLFSNRVRIYLDYEAGRISFYDLCDPIRHLHTFTTTFTEPLHAGICVQKGCIKICGGNWEM